MASTNDTAGARIAAIIDARSPAGRHDAVSDWHDLLKDLLARTAPYLREGHLITFRDLEAQERSFFEALHREVAVPPSVGAIYLPPSVRYQMLYHRPEGEPRPLPDHSRDNPPDEGIVLACRKADFSVVVNALLAKPPCTPAVDVYDDGQLLAGYVYNTIDACIGELTKVLETHLQPRA
jgi:hypothetical protein